MEEVRTKYKITVAGPNTLSALLQSYHLGFQTLKVQKHATQIYNDLKLISVRFEKHFSGIIDLRKKLEQACSNFFLKSIMPEKCFSNLTEISFRSL